MKSKNVCEDEEVMRLYSKATTKENRSSLLLAAAFKQKEHPIVLSANLTLALTVSFLAACAIED